MPEIRRLSIDQVSLTLPLIQELNPKLESELLLDRMHELFTFSNYQCLGIWEDHHLIGMTGIWETVRLYSGKQWEIDHFILGPEYRNAGLGAWFEKEITKLAAEAGCESLELNTYVRNTASHRFYTRNGYDIIGFHMIKRLI